jgi:hypothetical protein
VRADYYLPPRFSNNLKPEDGSSTTIDMEWKWSSRIMAELLDNAGGSAWERWKADRVSQGLPILDGADREPVKRTWLPKEEYRASVARLARRKRPVDDESTHVTKEVVADIEKARTGSGAAAILP